MLLGQGGGNIALAPARGKKRVEYEPSFLFVKFVTHLEFALGLGIVCVNHEALQAPNPLLPSQVKTKVLEGQGLEVREKRERGERTHPHGGKKVLIRTTT
jgi:hypothetical protein